MTSGLVRKLGVLCLAAVAIGVTLVGSPAQAAVASGSAAAGSGSVTASAGPELAAASSSVCHDQEFGGSYYCGYSKHIFTFSNGTRQIFVVATNFAVYTKWVTAAGKYSAWVSLGGQVRHSYSVSDFKGIGCGSQPVIYVVGTDNQWYNDARRTNGTWTGWRLGNVVACPA